MVLRSLVRYEAVWNARAVACRPRVVGWSGVSFVWLGRVLGRAGALVVSNIFAGLYVTNRHMAGVPLVSC